MNVFCVAFTTAGNHLFMWLAGGWCNVCPSKIVRTGTCHYCPPWSYHSTCTQGSSRLQLWPCWSDRAQENGTKSQRKKKRTAARTRGRKHLPLPSPSYLKKSKCEQAGWQKLPGKRAAGPNRRRNHSWEWRFGCLWGKAGRFENRGNFSSISVRNGEKAEEGCLVEHS